MCLIVNKEFLELKEAEENIPCYKSLRKRNRSTHNDFHYTKGKTYTEKGAVETQIKSIVAGIAEPCGFNGSFPLTYGFHSRPINLSWSEYDRSHLFMIPKGTIFTEGGENSDVYSVKDHDNYLSESIVYLGKNTWLNRLIYKWKYNFNFK